MDKGNVVCANNGIAFSYKQKGNSIICDSMVEHGGHYV
jgi:hypothetical protein